MKYDINSFQKKMEQLFPNDKIKLLKFEGTYNYIQYQCLKCNRIYEKSRASHLYENKSLCQHCTLVHNSKIRNWIQKFLKINSQFTLTQPWSGNTAENLYLHCKKCEQNFFKQPVNLYGKKVETICPYCGKNGAPIPFMQFQARLNEEQKTEYQFLTYTDIGKSCKIRHSCGFVFSQRPSNFIMSRGCPKCNKIFSRGERAICNYLNEHKITYETQYSFLDMKNKRYDFYLPEHNLLIEYNGKQHYTPVSYWGGQVNFIAQQLRDKEKQNYARQHNIDLLIIPYTEFNNLSSILEGATTKCNLKRDERGEAANSGYDIV